MKQQNPKGRFKEMRASQKQMDTARSRGIQLKEIVKYDLTTENYLMVIIPQKLSKDMYLCINWKN